MTTWYEREEDSLVRDFNEGRISREEYNKAMRDLQREVRDAAHQEAQDAYDRVMDGY